MVSLANENYFIEHSLIQKHLVQTDRIRNLRKLNSKLLKRQLKLKIDEHIERLEYEIRKLAREIYIYKVETRKVFNRPDDVIIISDSDLEF